MNNKITTLERTAAEDTSGLGYIFLAKIFALVSTVVKTQNGLVRMEASYLCNASLQRNNQIRLTYSKTCLNGHSKVRQSKDLNDKW